MSPLRKVKNLEKRGVTLVIGRVRTSHFEASSNEKIIRAMEIVLILFDLLIYLLRIHPEVI